MEHFSAPVLQRFSLLFQRFIFKHLPSLIPRERITAEAKFKTVLALLLKQESVRDFFLSDRKKKRLSFLPLKRRPMFVAISIFPPHLTLEKWKMDGISVNT